MILNCVGLDGENEFDEDSMVYEVSIDEWEDLPNLAEDMCRDIVTLASQKRAECEIGDTECEKLRDIAQDRSEKSREIPVLVDDLFDIFEDDAWEVRDIGANVLYARSEDSSAVTVYTSVSDGRVESRMIMVLDQDDWAHSSVSVFTAATEPDVLLDTVSLMREDMEEWPKGDIQEFEF